MLDFTWLNTNLYLFSDFSDLFTDFQTVFSPLALNLAHIAIKLLKVSRGNIGRIHIGLIDFIRYI